MEEKVTVYSPMNTEQSTAMNRSDFYASQLKAFSLGQKPDNAVAVVNVLLFNEAGELLVQKRSDHKTHNAGLLDKSIGGHIVFGDSPEYTAMVETVQELQVPSIVTGDSMEFQKTYKLLIEYLNNVAILRPVDTFTKLLPKIIKGDTVPVGNRVYLYLGIYSGAVKNVDREAKGILFYSIDDLEAELQSNPSGFTPDLGILLSTYSNQIKEFIASISS